MKRVWILERFVSKEEQIKRVNELERMMFEAADYMKTSIKETIKNLKEIANENEEGYWTGWEGKTNLEQFIDVATKALRRANKTWTFRVIEGLIDDNAKYWLDYEVVRENKDVMRFLMGIK